MDHLSKQQENFCDNAGLAGVLISLTCLFQHFYFMIPGWVTYSIIIVYLSALAGFILLMRKSPSAFGVLLISGILILALESFMILAKTYSLVLLLLLIYTVIIIALMYTSAELQKNLRRRHIAKKADEAEWEGKL